MITYRVLYKRYSEVHKNFILVEDNITASDMLVNECGCLTFTNEDGIPTHAFPPGFWFPVEPTPPVVVP